MNPTALHVRRCEAADLVILQRLESPLVLGSRKKSSTPFDVLEAVFLFTRPRSEVELILNSGRAKFRQAAVRALSGIGPRDAERLVAEIGSSISHHHYRVAADLKKVVKIANKLTPK